MNEGSITRWIDEVKNGNDDAAQAIWERYYKRLLSRARQELCPQSRRLADEDDIVQNVFENFFRAAESGRFPNLSDRDDLWRLLITMTARKAIDLNRRQHRAKRGQGNVRGESVFDDQLTTIAQVISEEPTPDVVVAINEQIRNLFSIVDDKELEDLVLAKLEGYTNKEIADRLACSERTVERRLRLIRSKIRESETREIDDQ